MKRSNSATLTFDSSLSSLRDGLSVALQIDNTLWVANDETISLERFNIQEAAAGEAVKCNAHQSFSLADFLSLQIPAEAGKKVVEADIEGLAYASETGYLWLTGSHSLKRKNAERGKSLEKNIERLADVSADGNRFLLARIPVVKQSGTYCLAGRMEADGRTAAQLHGDKSGNDLTRALDDDEHLGKFLHIPGKDNGFDIEGLAVVGPRLLLGLRGPVLRGWAVLLEIEPVEGEGSLNTLVLKKIGPGERPYRKHFLSLNGLGIRDLCVSGDDLLILAGPTTDLDGPVSVFRWRDGAKSERDNFVFADQFEKVLEVPFGEGPDQGTDHAEGMCLLKPGLQADMSLLIVYDSIAPWRKRGDTEVEGDLFAYIPRSPTGT